MRNKTKRQQQIRDQIWNEGEAKKRQRMKKRAEADLQLHEQKVRSKIWESYFDEILERHWSKK